jgi:hypothetical protein
MEQSLNGEHDMTEQDEQHTESYEGDFPLERVFQNAAARVLDFFVLNQKFDYSESDISRMAEVPRRTLDRVLQRLLNERLIMRTRTSSKSYMYMLNAKSARALALQDYCKATQIEYLEHPELFQVKQSKTTENARLFE